MDPTLPAYWRAKNQTLIAGAAAGHDECLAERCQRGAEFNYAITKFKTSEDDELGQRAFRHLRNLLDQLAWFLGPEVLSKEDQDLICVHVYGNATQGSFRADEQSELDDRTDRDRYPIMTSSENLGSAMRGIESRDTPVCEGTNIKNAVSCAGIATPLSSYDSTPHAIVSAATGGPVKFDDANEDATARTSNISNSNATQAVHQTVCDLYTATQGAEQQTGASLAINSTMNEATSKAEETTGRMQGDIAESQRTHDPQKLEAQKLHESRMLEAQKAHEVRMSEAQATHEGRRMEFSALTEKLLASERDVLEARLRTIDAELEKLHR